MGKKTAITIVVLIVVIAVLAAWAMSSHNKEVIVETPVIQTADTSEKVLESLTPQSGSKLSPEEEKKILDSLSVPSGKKAQGN
jgi:hypothetical protein